MGETGETLLAEIREQPSALGRLIEQYEDINAVACAMADRAPPIVRFVAHGSSDNAASYGVYAFGLLPGWTSMRDSISLAVYYRAELELRDSVVIALSQSGATPDVVEYVKQARGRGALTVAVTNESESELAEAADHVVHLAAGTERSVPATKTYFNELGALLLLAACIAGRGEETATALAQVTELAAECIAQLEEQVISLAVPFTFIGRMYVVGRGLELATAREVALKLTEVCRVAADSLTATDLTHGPVAALDPLFPVWAIASDDQALPSVVTAAERARAAGATLIATGSAADALGDTAYRLQTPCAPTPLLCPLLSVIPGQLFAWALARAKGLDPDQPTHLTKVTVVP